MGNEQSIPTTTAVGGGVNTSAADGVEITLTRQEKADKFAEELERRRLENVARKKVEREAVEEEKMRSRRQAEKGRDTEKVPLERKGESDGLLESTSRKMMDSNGAGAALEAKMEILRRGLAAQWRESEEGEILPAPVTSIGMVRGGSGSQNGADPTSSTNSVARAPSKALSNPNSGRGDTNTLSGDAAPSSAIRPNSPSVTTTPVLSSRGRIGVVSPRRESNDSGIGMPRSGIRKSGAREVSTQPTRRVSNDNNRSMAPPVQINNVKRPATTQADPEMIRKRRKTSDSSSVSPRSPMNGPEDSAARQPPAWYRALSIVPKRAEADAAVEPLLKALKTKITLCKDPRNTLAQQQTYNEIRRRIHELVFQTVNKKLLRNNSMLHNDRGLPQLFDEQYSGGVDWPFDIKADAKELYFKWCNQVFETDLLRGIIPGGGKSGSSDRSSDKLDPNWQYRVSPEFYGNGQLVNGQWWPTQLAALRDGGHGSSQAGIYGKPGGSAYSCIMAGNPEYADRENGDRDEGDVVYYCGTDSSDGSITLGTKHMISSSVDDRQPVRLIRSHKVPSKYAPEMGLRYDGLYDVVGYERLDPEKSLRQRHRFKLVRRTGQDPIRGGNGPEKRPTQQEMEAHQKDKRLRGVGGGGVIKGKKVTVFPTFS